MGFRRSTFRKASSVKETVGKVIRLGIIVACVIFFIWENNNLVVNNKVIYNGTSIPKPFVGASMVHITDMNNSKLDIVRKVENIKPFFIVITGNIADEDGNFKSSVKTINRLCEVAPTFYVFGENDRGIEEDIKAVLPEAVYLEDTMLSIDAPKYKDVNSFISQVYGENVVEKAENGDESAAVYLEYVKAVYADDIGKKIELAGVSDLQGEELLDRAYYISEHGSGNVVIAAVHESSAFPVLCQANIDLVVAGGTYGKKDESTGYSKGSYSANSTVAMISGGLGLPNEMRYRILNNPEIQQVIFSDGSIQKLNPLENLMSEIFGEVDTRFNGDKGFQEKKTTYVNGEEIN